LRIGFSGEFDVAKKNPEEKAAAAPRRSTSRRTTKQDPGAAIASAAERSGSATNGGSLPSPDEIAQLAYQRYLSRGATDGRDFDDWIEAERELSSRR
jgi:hypothetical protein